MKLQPLVHAFLCLALALALPGCGTLQEADPASFASVVIKNHPLDEIRAVTTQVFREGGFGGGASGPMTMTFDKQASGMDTIARDGFVAAQGGTRTVERVRVEIVSLGGGSHRIQCQAYMVSAANDAFFAEEHHLSSMRAGPYRALLAKVAAQLK